MKAIDIHFFRMLVIDRDQFQQQFVSNLYASVNKLYRRKVVILKIISVKVNPGIAALSLALKS